MLFSLMWSVQRYTCSTVPEMLSYFDSKSFLIRQLESTKQVEFALLGSDGRTRKQRQGFTLCTWPFENSNYVEKRNKTTKKYFWIKNVVWSSLSYVLFPSCVNRAPMEMYARIIPWLLIAHILFPLLIGKMQETMPDNSTNVFWDYSTL